MANNVKIQKERQFFTRFVMCVGAGVKAHTFLLSCRSGNYIYLQFGHLSVIWSWLGPFLEIHKKEHPGDSKKCRERIPGHTRSLLSVAWTQGASFKPLFLTAVALTANSIDGYNLFDK